MTQHPPPTIPAIPKAETPIAVIPIPPHKSERLAGFIMLTFLGFALVLFGIMALIEYCQKDDNPVDVEVISGL